MLLGSEIDNNIGILLINLSQFEGKFIDCSQQEDFLRYVYNGVDFIPPSIHDVMSGPQISWKELKTGDIAVFLNENNTIVGVVIGEIERQFCYADPVESIIKIDDYDECIANYKYFNGFRVIRVSKE